MVGGQDLHNIYVNRPKGTTQKQIFNELDEIRNLRNRIAHHEPICFNKKHEIFTGHTKITYDFLIKQIEWLGYDSKKLNLELDETMKFISSIDDQKKYLI